MSSDEQAAVGKSHQATEFTQGHDQVIQVEAFPGGSGSNFVTPRDPDFFEEEKLMRIDSFNEVANNHFEANEVTHHTFEAQAYVN